MTPAEFFGIVIDRETGKLRRVFNPDYDWEFDHHHVDERIEYLRFERKSDWGVPRVPNGMTKEMVFAIQQIVESGRNRPPGEE